MKIPSILFALLFAASAASAGTISGTVTTPDGPFLGLVVAAYNSAGTLQASSQTTVSGSYTLTLPAGSYRVLAYDPNGNYATSFYRDASSFDTSTVVSVGSGTTAISFVLARAAHITGRVNGSNGALLAGMTVVAYNLDGTRRAFTSTDATGAYDLTVPTGTYKLVAYDPALSYAATFHANANSFDNATPIAIAAPQTVPISLTLELADKVSGRVTDHITGAAAAGVTVAAYNADGTVRTFTTSSSTGTYALALPTGDFRIGVFDRALVYLTQFYSNAPQFSSATIVHTIGGANASGFDFAMIKGAHLTGRVIDRSTAQPVAGITVGAYDVNGNLLASARTDANGTYAIILTPATYKLLAFDDALRYATGYYANATSFAASPALGVTEAQSLTADFALAIRTVTPPSRRRAATH